MEDKTCRGKKFAAGAIQLFTRSFVVVLQVLLPKYLAGTNRSKKKILKKTVVLVRAMGKTASEKRAMEGDDLPESSGQAGAEPMTFEEQAEKYKKWIQKEKALMKRIQKLPAETPQNELSYMKGLLARKKARGLAWQFICQTTERVGTVHKLVPHLILNVFLVMWIYESPYRR